MRKLLKRATAVAATGSVTLASALMLCPPLGEHPVLQAAPSIAAVFLNLALLACGIAVLFGVPILPRRPRDPAAPAASDPSS